MEYLVHNSHAEAIFASRRCEVHSIVSNKMAPASCWNKPELALTKMDQRHYAL